MLVCLDDASCVVHPEELSQTTTSCLESTPRRFTLKAHAIREKKLEAKREQRLRRVSRQDAYGEEGATRTYETFGMSSFATWVSSEGNVTCAANEHVTVLYSGDFCVPDLHTLDDQHAAYVRSEPVENYSKVSNAQRMLDFYNWSNFFHIRDPRKHSCEPKLNTDFLAAKLERLAEANEREKAKGFAFVLYDKKHHRLVVARDSTANPEPLFWGIAPDGERGECLFVSTEERNELFSECFPAASAFPKGAVLVAEGTVGWVSGEKGVVCGPTTRGETSIRGFRKYGTMPVRTIPRVNSSGQMCGNVFRVESFGDVIADVVGVKDMKRHGSYSAMLV